MPTMVLCVIVSSESNNSSTGSEICESGHDENWQEWHEVLPSRRRVACGVQNAEHLCGVFETLRCPDGRARVGNIISGRIMIRQYRKEGNDVTNLHAIRLVDRDEMNGSYCSP
jgi:hypothetical protein